MIRQRAWRSMLVDGILLTVAIHVAGTAGQTSEAPQSSPPVYAIPLKDGRTATVWWDAVSDPANPSWRCGVAATRSGQEIRTTIPLAAEPGDWRAALAQAKSALKGLVTDSE